VDDDVLYSAVTRKPATETSKPATETNKGAYVPPSRRNPSGEGALRYPGKGAAVAREGAISKTEEAADDGVEKLKSFHKEFKLVCRQGIIFFECGR
jgi:hypothetical protein